MINLILFLLLFHYTGLFLFKNKSNTLSCGIFGQATNSPRRINQANIKILGMFNESRGKHSCGVSYDGEIYHGLDKLKLFTDFIKHNNFKVNKFPIIIGHTRSASSGVINHFNSHPFGFGGDTERYEFIGVNCVPSF